MIGVLATLPASAWIRGPVDVLAVLPDLVGQGNSGNSGPEGLTVGPDGNIYVTTFGFNFKGATGGPANLIVISPGGKIVNQVAITGSSPHVLGLAFNPVNGFLLVLDFGAGQVLNVNPTTGVSSVFMTLPSS
jgi:DNA-binding beta-propeller fold protein YncE